MNIGLKLWSVNTDFYYEEAKRLYQEHWYDYIELCIVPGSTETLKKWKVLKQEYNIPFALHAPHSMLGVNLADREKEQSNAKAYEDVALFAEGLSAKYTVVHAGVNGSTEETIRQLNTIKPVNILLENKPYKTIYGEPICRGAVPDEIIKIFDGYPCGFCLDVGHAICTANALGMEPYGFLQEMQKLTPSAYHLSDNYIDGDIDRHLHLGEGTYDLKRIMEIIDPARDVAIETVKRSKTDLDDFVYDLKYLRGDDK